MVNLPSRDRVAAGLVDLDEVGAFLELLADHGDEFVGVVGVGGVGENVLLGIVADGVFVAAENVDGVAADAQARAGNQAVIDGVAHGGVGRARAFGAHVALGGEAGHQIVAGGERGEDGALRDGFLDGLQVFGAGMQEQMHVGVDQAGQQRGVAEIDDLRAGGMRDGRADGGDAIALDQDFAGRRDVAGFDVEQARGMQDDGARGLRGRENRRRSEEREDGGS